MPAPQLFEPASLGRSVQSGLESVGRCDLDGCFLNTLFPWCVRYAGADGRREGALPGTSAGTPPGVGAPPCGGTLRRAVPEEPAVALARRRRGSEAAGVLRGAPSLMAASGRRPAAGLTHGSEEAQWSPEALALPGSGPVRGHKPRTRGSDAFSVPSDRSGGQELLWAAGPPRAAEGNDGDSGRIPPREIGTQRLTARAAR